MNRYFKEFVLDKNPQSLIPLIDYIDALISKAPLVGVCGGTSIGVLLNSLSIFLNSKSNCCFNGSHFVMIDERLVPSSHADSNVRVVREGINLTSISSDISIKISEFNTSDVDQGILEYNKILSAKDGIFDLIFLGVGEDAHIAGLFPLLDWKVEDNNYFFTFENSPKPPPNRMTASPRVIKNSKINVVLFFGENKRNAYERFIRNSEPESECPVLLTRYAENLIVVRDFN